MTRMARSQTNIAAPNQGLAKVSTQSFQHSVPQFQSSSEGLDPFRGDMTNAFNSFFGSLQNSAQTVIDVQREKQKVEAADYANDMKARAATEAQDYYVRNPTARDVNTALETEDADLQSNRHFVNTYKQSLGSNIGSRLYSDFTASQANANPANFEANAQAFWEENYAGGTGDPQVDLAMQTSWSRNYENNRISAAQETIRRQRAAAALEHRRSIYRGLQGDVSVESLNALMGSGPSSGGETRGQISSRNFGIVMEAVANGDLSSEQINVVEAWINNVPNSRADGTGASGQSIAQRFPILAANAERNLPIIRARSATLQGQQAVVDITNQLNEGMAQFDDPVDQMNYLNQNAPVMIEELRNTRGVTSGAISDFRTDINTRRAGMLDYVKARSEFDAVGSGGDFGFGFNPTGTTEQQALVDAFSAAENGIEAGQLLGAVYSAGGAEAIAPAIRNNLNAQLISPNPELRLRAAQTILTASGVSGSFNTGIQDALLDEDAQLRMNVIRSYMDQGKDVNSANIAASNVDAAVELVKDEGFLVNYNTTGTKAEQELELQSFFHGDNMLDELEKTVEGRGFLTSLFTFQRGRSITAEAQAAMRREGDSFIIQQRALGLKRPTQAQIREHVAGIMVDRMYIEQGVWKYNSSVQPSSDENRVRVGVSVYNPQTGFPENTLATQQKDASVLVDSFFRFNFNDENGDQLPFRTIPIPGEEDTNSQLLILDDLPVDLAVGRTFRIDQEYYSDGENKGQLRGALNDVLNGAENVVLTGDLKVDAELLFPALGPGITLIPNWDGDTIRSYALRMTSRFTGRPSVDVEAMAKVTRNMPTDPSSFDPATGFTREEPQSLVDQIPASFWETEEGINLKQALDQGDPNSGYYLEGVARRFAN